MVGADESTRLIRADGRLDFLRRAPLFADVPDRVVERVAGEMEPLTLQRGGRLFWEGDPAGTFYLIREGLVKVLRETATGRNVLFEFLRSGEMVGALAIVGKTPFPATAVAATSPTVLLTLPAVSFLRMLNEEVILYRNYSREIGQRLAEARKWQIQIAYNMEGRVAQHFLRLAGRIGKPEDSALVIPQAFTRQETADMVGTTVETAIRILSDWRKKGFIRIESDVFVIEKPDQLERIARGA